ncbi:MAG: TonB-dependent receptor, partial [Bacteroidales bacterium]|nr:TonB-dependent receptor [Bacteroidales bacterium]
MKVFRQQPGSWIRKGLIIGAFFMIQLSARSQDNNITVRFDSILFRDLADTLENIVPYKFYYPDTWVDSLAVSVNLTNASVRELLEQVLNKEGFSFIITDENQVIISKDYSVKTNFSTEYLGYLESRRMKSDTSEYLLPAIKEKKSTISDEYRIFRIGQPASGNKSGVAVLSGTVISTEDSKSVNGVIVYVEKLKAGAMTNENGAYALSIPKGQYQVEYRMVGMQTARRNIKIYSDGVLNVEMAESTNEVEAVVVTGNRSNSVRDVRTGIEKINLKMLRQIPMGLGEADVLKSSLLLPGVQTVGEASAGFNVRGGSADQNLVFLNNAPVINTSHFFGFFSAFNSDLVSDVTLYKSGMPAKYGGRLSSVMEITPAEGNREKIKVSGGISPVTGRIMVEGPLDKINGTFILGTRATYSDWILGLLKDFRLSKSRAGFYDIQGMVKSVINEKNTLSLSGYLSNDKFDYYRERAFNYGNRASTLKWEHFINPQLSAQIYAIVSNYRYQSDMNNDSTYYSSMNYEFNQKILRADFLYNPSAKHKIEFGVDATYYSLLPGVIEPVGTYSRISPKQLGRETAMEPSLYISDEFEVTPLFSVSGGLRGTLFTAFGPRTEFQYQEGFSKSVGSQKDTVSYRKGEI